jgi:uncharacterized protein (TIGR02246 family)
MWHRLVVAGVIALLIPALLGAQNAPRNEAVEKEIAQLDRDFHQARLRNDVAAVNRFFSSDYYQINTGGERIEAGNKGAGPFNTTPNGDRWEKVDISNQRVRVYLRHTAVSTYLRHINVRNGDGSSREVELVSSHVWVRRDNRWQLVLSQATALP